MKLDASYQLPSVLCFEEERGAVVTGAGFQGADAELAGAVFALVHYFKALYTVIGEEILEHHYRLRLAVGIAFFGQAYLDIIIYIACKFGGIARAQGIDNVIQAAQRLECAGHKNEGRTGKCKYLLHINGVVCPALAKNVPQWQWPYFHSNINKTFAFL
jgi:hypothetical protein